ncbi:facilitated trehalose transporter Tret1-like [Odontomachus brunneus]|uniref:facilitated trehalose transporter Tret1-like n=1 Tax=Odontomachus brunneus TaxID=486640 RepID=UPI0013F2431D|nr:facilitated trehalose transporter Tret1-like [Odontomachus brunneus]
MSVAETTSPTEDDDGAKIQRSNQHVAALVASLGGFALGVTLGWNSSAGKVLRDVLYASGTEIGLVGGILNAGACVGVILAPFFTKYLSRGATLLLTTLGFIVGWSFICFADQKVSLFIIGRFVCGASGGVFCILTPFYIAEIADRNSRERLLMYFHLLINCGIMYAFVVAHVLDETDAVWRYSLTCAVTCLMIPLIYLLPESPLRYLAKDDETNARTSLKWFRGHAYKDDAEMEELKRLADTVRLGKITRDVLCNRRIVRPCLACVFAFLTQQLSGVNIMLFYSLTLFDIGGSGYLTASELTVILGAVQILSCLVATGLIDVLGRRALLAVSSVLMGLFLVLLGWFYKLREQDPEYDDIYYWMPPTWTTLFFAAYNVGFGPISWSLLGDSFPMEMRTTAASCAAAFTWLLSLTATMTFGEMLDGLGVLRTMWLFASFCWLAGAVTVPLVKDTRGHSLAKIQESLATGEARAAERNIPERT